MATGPNRIDPTPVRMTTDSAQPRVTPKTDFGDRVKDNLTAVGGAVATGVGVAASYVPGGAILSAAVSGAGTFATASSSGQAPAGAHVGTYYMSGIAGSGSSVPVPGGTVPPVTTTPPGTTVPPGGLNVPPSTGGDPMSMLQQQAASNMQFLMLQSQMNMENQQFTTLSNVMKTRQDTVSNTIRNMAV